VVITACHGDHEDPGLGRDPAYRGTISATVMGRTGHPVQDSLDGGGATPTVLSSGMHKGRDYAWVGAGDGLRLNRYVYDFEVNGVNARRVR
jgi:hypothetical protein